jgi:hypothetical protein
MKKLTKTMDLIIETFKCSVRDDVYFDVQTLINLKLVNKEISKMITIDLQSLLYAEYYKTCPDLVYSFENQIPWMNFYDAIEYSEINMITLLNIIKGERYIGSNIIRKDIGSLQSFAITYRLLSNLCKDLKYVLENYITYKLFTF